MTAGPDAVEVRQALEALSVMQDHVTRLPNRRAFRMLGQQLIEIAERHQHEFTVFLLRIDNLDAIRAAMGEREGNWTLVAAAEVLRATFRESDVIARLRDDEFVVLAMETSADEVPLVEDRIAVGLRSAPALESRAEPVLVRVGAAPYGRGATLNELIERASSALRKPPAAVERGASFDA
jgi:diguanylate cyclase (GGDEF)-like protein